MFSYTLKTLERHLLSPARRLFIYDQMRDIARAHQLGSLSERIEQARNLDTLNVERATRWRHWNRMERTHPGVIFRTTTDDELRASSERGQQELLTLVYFIIHSPAFDHEGLRSRLLEPLLQQMRRLDHYAERVNDAATSVEAPSKTAKKRAIATPHAFEDSTSSSLH